jgi:hypothetical protein
MSPNLWLPDLIPKGQTSILGDQVLLLEEQINAWYGVSQKMAWGIQDVEFEKLSASLSQKLTNDDHVFGYIGVALFYGFGDDGQGNADSTLSGKLAWEYAGKHRKKNTWQCGYIDFKKPENIRLRPGAAVRPKGFYFAKIQLGQKYLGISVSQLRQSLKMETGWGPEGPQFLFITHFHFADLMDERKIPFMTLADYDVTLQGVTYFFKVPQIFCSNKKIGLGIGNVDHNYPPFGIPTLQICSGV